MSISTTDDHKMQGGKVLLQLRNGCNQIFMAFNIGEPADRSDDQCIRGTAEPFRLLFSLHPHQPKPLTVDPARHYGEPVSLADSPIEVILPFSIREGNQSMRDRTQHPFDLEK